MAGLGGRAPIPFSVAVSNVPGPTEPLYFNGSRLDAIFPLSLLLHGNALNITCLSYAGTLNFGFTGARDTLPHMQQPRDLHGRGRRGAFGPHALSATCARGLALTDTSGMDRLLGQGGLTRRRMLQLSAAAGMAATLPLPLRALAAGFATQDYDDGNADIPGGIDGEPERVVIVGAGWAGLTAANALRNAGVECVVLEGRPRIGGRARTRDVDGHPVDLGCSWIHEPVGNPMTRFADQAGVG